MVGKDSEESSRTGGLKGPAVLESRIKVLGGSHPSPERLRAQKWEVGWSLESDGLCRGWRPLQMDDFIFLALFSSYIVQ